MKHIYFSILLLFISIIALAQERDRNLIRTRIISREEMTVTGSFSFTLEVLAYDTCTLDSIRIINDGTFLNISFNGSLSKSQNISQPSFTQKNLLPGQTSTCVINVTHATSNIPYYPEDMGFIICLHENSYNIKNHAGGKVYFTPYNSVEIWDQKDFRTQPRVWATRVSPAPTRVFIARTAIPVSTKPTNPQIQYDWQKYYQVTHVEGLPYLIQMAAVHPDTIKYYKNKDSIEVWNGLHNGQLGKGLFGNDFRGTITGRLRSNYVPDGQNNTINIGLEGVHVAAYDENITYDDKLGEVHTDANGYFSISYSSWQSSLEGSNIELFVQYWSENLNYDIEVEIDPYWSWVPVLFNVAPETSHSWIGDVGTSYNRNLGDIGVEGIYDGAFKTLNWAYKAYKFSKDKLGSLSGDFTRSLDILTESNLDQGTSAQFNSFYGNRINLARNSDLHEGTIWHEFGHFLMHQLQNGYVPGNTGGDYNRWGNAHINLAWNEGWADGFAMICDVYYRYYDNESEQRRTGFFNDPVPFEARSIYQSTNGFKSVYQIGCTILDLYDGPGKFLNLPNIAPTVYNDASTNNGYRNVTPMEQDEVSLSFEMICKAMLLQDHVGQFYSQLQNQQTDICMLNKIKRVFTLNGITNPVNSYFNATHHLNSDPLFTTSQTDGSNFNMDISEITSNYNFGANATNVSMVLTDQLTVSNSAKLSFNGNGNTGFGNGLPPINNSVLNVQICNRFLTINNSSTLEIGGTNLLGNINLKNGTSLILNNGSNLIINNNSQLVIESGAMLIFNKGATINLLGPNSVIIVKHGGKIQIGQDAIFNYTGDGFIRFETNNTYETSKSIEAIGQNAQFKLVGGAFGSTTKKLMEITGGGTMEDLTTTNSTATYNLRLFSIQNENIVLNTKSRILVSGINTIAQFRSVEIKAAIPSSLTNRHRGVVVNGQSGNSFYKVTVSDAEIGITSNSFYGGNDIQMMNVTATRCSTGIFIWGAGAVIQDANINNCEVAIKLIGMKNSTRLYRSVLFYNTVGVEGTDCINNVIELYQPHIYNNFYGVKAINSEFSSVCGLIKNNTSSVTNSAGKYEGANVYLTNNSNLILDPVLRTGSGKTDLGSTRGVAIRQLNASYGPYINQSGSSLLTNIDYSITGTLAKAFVAYPNISAISNLWGYTGTTSRIPQISIDYDTKYLFGASTTPVSIDYIDNIPLPSFANCNTVTVRGVSTGSTGGEDRMRGFINGTVTPIVDLPNKQLADGSMLKEKIQEGYNYFFDLSPNYDLAIRDLTDALNAPFTSSELADWNIAISVINSQLIEALSEGINEGNLITHDGSNSNNYSEIVLNIINLQDKLLTDFSGNNKLTFKILLAKASLYRVLGNLEVSNQILNEVSRNLYPEMNSILESFNCIVNKEKLLKSGQITFRYFEDSLIQCPVSEDYSLLPTPYIDNIEDIEKTQTGNNFTNNEVSTPIKIYPNPNNGTFNIKFKGIEATKYSIEIVDIIGKKVYNSSGIVLLYNNIKLELDFLNAGTYFLKMINGKDVQTKQLVIVK